MTTRKITVTDEPQKITDGSSTAVIQFTGSVSICDSTTKPSRDAPAIVFHEIQFPENYRYRIVTVTPPTVAWIWASKAGRTVEVVIL
ncbi:hypothetical protein ID80_001000 [Salmonella enterica subsp. enterica serovar Ball]|nr:hypothetical protein [Salmonella enterica subsp. enterica serovar Ball]